MNKKLIAPILVILVVAGFIGWKLSSNKAKIDKKNEPVVQKEIVIPVSAITLEKEMVNNELTKIGNLIPNREADITAATAGKLTSVNFNLGSYVSQGGVVAKVDNRQAVLNLQQARTTKTKYDKDYTRYKTLLEGEATTEASFQDIRLQRDNAANQIELLNKQIADASVRAPISGQIVSKLKEPGEYVNPGTPLGHIVDISVLKANVMISETDAYSLRVGNKVTVMTDVYPDVALSGTISFISNQGDATHNYPVEVTLHNSKSYPLKAGTTVTVNFNKKGGGMLLTIPRTALTSGTKDPKIHVVENGIARLKSIVIGQEIGNNIEVVSGVEEGTQVITSGQINITEGSKVNVVSSQK